MKLQRLWIVILGYVALAVIFFISRYPAAVAKGDVSFSAREIDFGQVPTGTCVKEKLTLSNNGSKPVTINKIISSCACTTTEAENTVIGPGNRTDILVSIDTTNMVGKIDKSICVTFMNDNARSCIMYFKGYAFTSTAFLSPAHVDFGDVEVGAETRTVLTILNDDANNPKWRINSRIECPQYVYAEYRPAEAKIICTLDKSCPVGVIDGNITLNVSLDEKKWNVLIPVSGKIVNRFRLSRESFFMGNTTAFHWSVGLFSIIGDGDTSELALSTEEKPHEDVSVDIVDKHTFTLNVRSPKIQGIFSGDIVLVIKDGTKFKVRYMGCVLPDSR